MAADLASKFREVCNYQEFASAHQRMVNRMAEGLITDVLAHFNCFVNGELVPLFEPRYGVEPATKADYDCKGFKIYMGKIIMPQGHGERFWPGEKAENKLREYEKNTPWVSRVVSSFYYPK